MMRFKLFGRVLLIFFLGVVFSESAVGHVLYKNTFDDPDSLNDFEVFEFVYHSCTPPDLEEVEVESGQLTIKTYHWYRVEGELSSAVSGGASVMMDTSFFDHGYNTVLSENADIITWSFNLSNEDGEFNNGFNVVLVSSNKDPYSFAGARGYSLKGGGMGGSMMGLWRFDNGLGGAAESIIEVEWGLGTLPQKGSIKITYDPKTDEWALYGVMTNEYTDPEKVTWPLGKVIDGTYTNRSTPFMGFVSTTTGVGYFDNLTISMKDSPNDPDETDKNDNDEVNDNAQPVDQNNNGESSGSGGCFINTSKTNM